MLLIILVSLLRILAPLPHALFTPAPPMLHRRSLPCSSLFRSAGHQRVWRLPERSIHGGPSTPQAVEQRQRRPLSPHLSIYQPQLTWVMSIGHRATGAGLAGLLYVFGLYYGIAQPGAITEAAALTLADVPGAVVATGKFVLALPFWYHLANGIRHLVWDTGRSLSLRATYVGGWTVNAFALVAATASALV